MAKPDSKPEPQDAPAAPAAEFPVSLDNFCADLSKSDKRVELIGGFHFTERAAGRLRDVASAYSARFQSFVTRPA